MNEANLLTDEELGAVNGGTTIFTNAIGETLQVSAEKWKKLIAGLSGTYRDPELYLSSLLAREILELLERFYQN